MNLDSIFLICKQELLLKPLPRDTPIAATPVEDHNGRNYAIKVSGERLYLGVPPENVKPLTANVDPAEFPVLEIQPFSHEGKAASDKTPRPTVV